MCKGMLDSTVIKGYGRFVDTWNELIGREREDLMNSVWSIVPRSQRDAMGQREYGGRGGRNKVVALILNVLVNWYEMEVSGVWQTSIPSPTYDTTADWTRTDHLFRLPDDDST